MSATTIAAGSAETDGWRADAVARHVVVVGAGPVGCLAALMLAKRGWNVSVYEGRPDLRLPSSKQNARARSINLAISHRGIAALQAIDPAATEKFLEAVIPMRGRMIHRSDGTLDSQPYDRHGQCINSIDRSLLNEGLLDQVARVPRIRLFFEHKVRQLDFDKKLMVVERAGSGQAGDISVDFDFCVGADGSYSVVRRQMMRYVRMNYEQEYLKHEYLELRIPADSDGSGQPSFSIDPNHLHIWPRHSFMLIALANKDKTFTSTLFAPSEVFDVLTDRTKILEWFGKYFRDALQAIGEKKLIEDFERNPRSPLICTKSNPYHYKDCAILLGDAAHSMTPFYGQGLNCGLEDVRILDILLSQEHIEPNAPSTPAPEDERLASALRRYSESRHKDLIAIQDLAMRNYEEMRHLVTTPMYTFKKALDNILYSLTVSAATPLPSLAALLAREEYAPGKPRGWLPLYTMVTFRPDISYAVVEQKAERQSRILSVVGWTVAALLGVAAGFQSLRVAGAATLRRN